MKGREKRPAGELVPFPGVVSGHRDGWRWEPAMQLPSRWRRKDLRYDDGQGTLTACGLYLPAKPTHPTDKVDKRGESWT